MDATTVEEPTRPAVLISSDDGIGSYPRMGYLPLRRWTLWVRPDGLCADGTAAA